MAELATRRPRTEHQKSWIENMFKRVIKTTAVAMLAATTSTPVDQSGLSSGDVSTPSLNSHQPAVGIETTATDTVLSNGAAVYGNAPELAAVVNEFPTVWQEGGFADVPENEWMRIPLRSDWEDKVPKTARVYPLGKESKQIMDDTFDKLHQQGRMQWTTKGTPFSYPVFVVWTTRPNLDKDVLSSIFVTSMPSPSQTSTPSLCRQTSLVPSKTVGISLSSILRVSFISGESIHSIGTNS